MPVDVYEEMLEALEIQEGVTPSGELVALQGLAGASVFREEGDFVACHIQEGVLPTGGAVGPGGGGVVRVIGTLAVLGLVAGGAYAVWKSRK